MFTFDYKSETIYLISIVISQENILQLAQSVSVAAERYVDAQLLLRDRETARRKKSQPVYEILDVEMTT